MLRSPAIALEALRLVPSVVRVLSALRREPDLRRLLASLAAAPPAARGTLRRQQLTLSAVQRLVALVTRGGAGHCVVRSLILYRALRHQGWPVTFASGIRRVADGVVGACLDRIRRPAPAPTCRLRFPEPLRVNFRY